MATSNPAIVRGNVQPAIMHEVNDARGNLVDIMFYCNDCAEEHATGEECLPWPGYPFSSDYTTSCNGCGAPIHEVPDRDA